MGKTKPEISEEMELVELDNGEEILLVGTLNERDEIISETVLAPQGWEWLEEK